MLNPAYNNNWQQAREVLDEQGFVLLGEVLAKETYEELLAQLQAATYQESYEPALHRYQTTLVPQLVHEVLQEVSQQLHLQTPTRTQLRKYSRGSYTLHDDDEEHAGVEYALLASKDWEASWRGEITYTHPDKQPLKVPVQANAILIIKREAQTGMFVKRVTHHATNEYYAAHSR